MKIQNRNQSLVLFLGDIIALLFSLFATLMIRFGEVPAQKLFFDHLLPFSFIFAIWVVFYFIYDLYGSQTIFFQKRLANLLSSVHVVNSIIALAFFYFIPYFSITPKTTLFIFLITSFVFLTIWRRNLSFFFNRGREQNILFACKGKETLELIEEFTNNPLYRVSIIDNLSSIDNVKEMPFVVINTHDQDNYSIKDFYNMLFSGAKFITLDSLYESVFGRVPISSISERWFLEEISIQPKPIYDFIKRAMDIVVALVLGILSLFLYPLVFLAIKLDDQGSVFITQKRIGKNNKLVKTYKFRSMSKNIVDLALGKENQITKVGLFLRKTRIDELPQLWAVVKGDMSLIGPRPELPSGVSLYSEEIPYYAVRNLIKPGLSGWAQITQVGEPHHGLNVNDTAIKLSYDLYYLKYRNIFLDLKVALKTIRILLSRSGI